jgi:hypothetical protein
MRAWLRMKQWTVIAAVSVAGACIAAPAAQAGAARSAAAESRIVPIAATRPAPLVTNPDVAVGGKRGLPAPAMSPDMVMANAVRQAGTLRLLRRRDRRHPDAVNCGNVACRAGLPATKDLLGTQQPQLRNYFCGPATVSEMLAQMGVKLNQWAAAKELGTTQNGTDWSDASGYPVPRVLNENQHMTQYVAVALPWSPSTRQLRTFEADLVTDINKGAGVPLAGNAYEVAGGPHLVGNPVNQTIMHWIDIRGYSDGGKVTNYEDSVHDASSIGWAAGVPAYSSLASSTMVNILGARGYDW